LLCIIFLFLIFLLFFLLIAKGYYKIQLYDVWRGKKFNRRLKKQKIRRKTVFFAFSAFFSHFFVTLQADMRRIHQIMIAMALAVLAAGCKGTGGASDSQQAKAQSIDTVPMLIMQVQKCAKLYTAEYHVHKIVTHDDVVRLKGTFLQQTFNIKMPLGERKIAIPMDATLKAYIDFGQFSEKNIERRGNKITLVLPDPKVTLTSSKVDQRNIRQYVGFARANFSDAEMTSYEQQGRAAIIESIPELGILETAQENAARVLVPMLTELGYREENITIAFRKDYGTGDLKTLLEGGI
jgi:hypothetical protein